jgi:dihydroxyacetone kinase
VVLRYKGFDLILKGHDRVSTSTAEQTAAQTAQKAKAKTDRNVLHATVDDADHLSEGGLGRGLIHQALASQVDVVARAHSLLHQSGGCKQASKQASKHKAGVASTSSIKPTLSKVPSWISHWLEVMAVNKALII